MSDETSPSHSGPVDDETLLRSVAQHPGLVWAGGVGHSVDCLQLSVLPGSHSQNVAHSLTLLLAPQKLHVFSSSHFRYHVDLKIETFVNNSLLQWQCKFTIVLILAEQFVC